MHKLTQSHIYLYYYLYTYMHYISGSLLTLSHCAIHWSAKWPHFNCYLAAARSAFTLTQTRTHTHARIYIKNECKTLICNCICHYIYRLYSYTVYMYVLFMLMAALCKRFECRLFRSLIRHGVCALQHFQVFICVQCMYVDTTWARVILCVLYNRYIYITVFVCDFIYTYIYIYICSSFNL